MKLIEENGLRIIAQKRVKLKNEQAQNFMMFIKTNLFSKI